MTSSTGYHETDLTPRRIFARQGPEVIRAKVAAGDYLHDAEWQRDAVAWLREIDLADQALTARPSHRSDRGQKILSWITVTLVVLAVVAAGMVVLLHSR